MMILKRSFLACPRGYGKKRRFMSRLCDAESVRDYLLANGTR